MPIVFLRHYLRPISERDRDFFFPADRDEFHHAAPEPLVKFADGAVLGFQKLDKVCQPPRPAGGNLPPMHCCDVILYARLINEWYAKDTSKKNRTMFKEKMQEGKRVSMIFKNTHDAIIDEVTWNNAQRLKRRLEVLSDFRAETAIKEMSVPASLFTHTGRQGKSAAKPLQPLRRRVGQIASSLLDCVTLWEVMEMEFLIGLACFGIGTVTPDLACSSPWPGKILSHWQWMNLAWPERKHLKRNLPRHRLLLRAKCRRDNVTRRKFRWVSSAEKPDGCHAEGCTHLAGPVRPMLVLKESPMKADVIHALTGFNVLAVPGVNALTQLEAALDDLRSEGLIEIKTAFDMDFSINQHVQNGYGSLLALLGSMGFQFGTYLWDSRCIGLDDYLWEYCLQKGVRNNPSQKWIK